MMRRVAVTLIVLADDRLVVAARVSEAGRGGRRPRHRRDVAAAADRLFRLRSRRQRRDRGRSAGAVERAAATWQRVPSATVRFEFAGHDVGAAGRLDGRTTLGFHRSSRSRSRARRHQLPDRYDHAARSSRPTFSSTRASPGRWRRKGEPAASISSRWRCTSSGTCSGLGHSAIGETERNGTGGRRVIGSRRRDVSDRADAPARSPIACCRPTTSPAFPISIRRRRRCDTGGIIGRVTKNGQGVHRRARGRVQSRDRHSGRQFHAERRTASSSSPGCRQVRTSCASSRSTMRIRTASFRRRSTPISGVTYAPRMVVAPNGGSSQSIEIRGPAEMRCRCAGCCVVPCAWLLPADRVTAQDAPRIARASGHGWRRRGLVGRV